MSPGISHWVLYAQKGIIESLMSLGKICPEGDYYICVFFRVACEPGYFSLGKICAEGDY